MKEDKLLSRLSPPSSSFRVFFQKRKRRGNFRKIKRRGNFRKIKRRGNFRKTKRRGNFRKIKRRGKAKLKLIEVTSRRQSSSLYLKRIRGSKSSS